MRPEEMPINHVSATSTMSEPVFKITLRGGVSPETLRAGELAELLRIVEDAILGIAEQEGDVDADDLYISLQRINRGSAKLLFTANMPTLAWSAYFTLSTALATANIASIPRPAISAVQRMGHFATDHRIGIRFHRDLRSAAALAEIRPQSVGGLMALSMVSSETTLYGRLERVGGANPIARLRVSEDRVVSCQMSKALAKRIAPRLYEIVGLEGQAQYDMKNWSLVSFKATGILPYSETSIQDAVGALRNAAPDAWQGVDDVVGAVRELRGGFEG